MQAFDKCFFRAEWTPAVFTGVLAARVHWLAPTVGGCLALFCIYQMNRVSSYNDCYDDSTIITVVVIIINIIIIIIITIIR